MNREQFNKYSTDFSLLNSESLENIRNLLEEFPYFQTAWILYIKNLDVLKDVRFESNLKIATVYIPDRGLLKRVINGTYIPGDKLKNAAIQDNIDLALDFSNNIVFFDPDNVSQNVNDIDLDDKELLNFDFEGEKDKDINDSSSNIQVRINAFNGSKYENTGLKKPDKTRLIDKFLESDPRIIPDMNHAHDDSAANSLTLSEDDGLFSETLAKIYLNQEHYDKSILTYEKLCLKYPEKSIYFAGQIEKIKELIKNKKN